MPDPMLIAITINCPTAQVADEIANALLQGRLVAAVNRYPEIASRYVWRGKVETAIEVPLTVKTREDLFDRVADAIRFLHPYETPSIVATAITDANAEYIDWVKEVTSGDRNKHGRS